MNDFTDFFKIGFAEQQMEEHPLGGDERTFMVFFEIAVSAAEPVLIIAGNGKNR